MTGLRRSALLGVAGGVLGIVSYLLYSDLARDQNLHRSVTHTYEVLAQFQALASAIEHESASPSERSILQSLLRLTSDNPAQQARLVAIGKLVDKPDQCRQIVAAGEKEERVLLAQRLAAAESQALRTRWVLWAGTGSLLLMLIIAGTVIERDRSAMRKSDERLRLALDSANAGIWEWDLRTNANVWSEELWKLYGLEPHSCTPSYEAWRQVLHPDDRSNAEKLVGDAARLGVELNVEFRVTGRDGREHWLLARGQPLRDAKGRPESFIGIALDITRRKRAEEILRRFTEAAPVPIAMFDGEMRYLAASRRYSEDYKLDSQELVGRSHYQIFPEIPESWREIHRRCLAGAVERSPGELFLRSDGSEQWIRWEIQPWRLGSGEIGGIVLYSEDITLQKRAEQALLDSEARLRLAQQIARIGTFERNFQTGIGAWTPELEAIYGLPPGSFDGNLQTWENLVHPNDRSEAVRQVSQAMETGKLEGEWRIIRPDGAVRWIASRASVLHNQDGEPQRWVGVNIDITEAKEAEQALRRAHAELRKSEQRFRQVFENAPNGIAIVTWDGRFRETNPAFCALLRYTDDELHGLHFGSLVHPEDQSVNLADAERLRAGNLRFVQNESRYVRKDGSPVWVQKVVSILPHGTGGPRQVVVMVADITERKEKDLEIRRLNAELEQRVMHRTAELQAANKELEAFSYSVSHDLRAPLRGIDSWSLALAEDYAGQLDSSAQQYLSRIRSETQRMGSLIDDMLQLSRISSTGIRHVPVDLTDIAQQISSELLAAEPGRRIEFVIAPGMVASGDPRLLRVALTNLLSNAAKFTGPREKARIKFAMNQPGVFSVRDNGVGFDMAYVGSLFRAFQRLHKASEFPGTGIGLAIVQRVVRRHGGEVWAEAQPGTGATFYFTLDNEKA